MMVRFAISPANCRRMLGVIASAALSLTLVGCGVTHVTGTQPATPLPCSQLAGVAVPASAIGLPTSGALVTAATTVAASGVGASKTPEYCKVLGSIKPVDPAAPPINFEIDMPTNWNKKVMMFGGGGYDGAIPATAVNVPAGPLDQPTPLGRGYAVFASDSGHQSASKLNIEDGSFGVNDEALRNFSGDALKKTRDAAIYLIDARYAVNKPDRAYFAGGSSGGREALAVVQRWPQDWDGAIALYPAWNAASLDLQFGRITRAFAASGAYLNPAKRKTLYDAVMATCDGLDGVKDGIISNVAACRAKFNPRKATLHGKPLRCRGGADTGDTCLSDAQIAALNVYNTPITFDYPLASGETQYPGFNVYGADLGMAGTTPEQTRMRLLTMGVSQPAHPMPADAPFLSVFWDQWIRYFVTRDLGYDSLSVDPQRPGPLQARISELTALQDVNQTDLSAFAAKGGKLLIAHGTSDVVVSTRATEQYFQRLQTTMGAAKVREFARYYEIPGYGHAVGTAFNAAWDSLTTLENWVEKGVAPPPQIVADTYGVPGRARPLCEYPAWPKYAGSGDVDAASSFACALR
ncbi:tannase/feruloyl esterase family alpha/beta hydrolase [Trinickia sp. YCB016]